MKHLMGMQSSATGPAACGAMDGVPEQGLLKPSQPLWVLIQVARSEPSVCLNGPGPVLIACYSPPLLHPQLVDLTVFALIGKMVFV